MLPQKLGLGSQAALVISHPSARMGRCSETEKEPVEASRVQEPFHVSHFLPIEKGFPPPRPSLSSKGQIQTVLHSESEGIQKETSVKLRAWPGSSCD